MMKQKVTVGMSVIMGALEFLISILILYLEKTIKGYGFCFDFIAMGIIFSTQIINRSVAEPSLCKDSIKFSRCLEALLADLQR